MRNPLFDLSGRTAGRGAEGVSSDVTDEAAVMPAFEAFDRRGAAIDILVDNAGIQLRKPMVELSTTEWQRVIDTKLTSAFVIGREAGRRMAARKQGKIIDIGSLTLGEGRSPARLWGLPGELAGVAVVLAAPASKHFNVNGQILYVDGGFSAVP